MNFINIRDALVSLLGASQGTSWKTIGFVERDQSAKENSALPTVQVYYAGGDFPKNKSSLSGPIQHEMRFTLMLTVAEKAKGDISALENAETAEEYEAAVATFSRAENEADSTMDELLSKVWNVVMNAANRNLGLDITEYPRLSDRWIASTAKELPKRVGQLCTMRGMMTVTARIPEDITGAVPGIEYNNPPYSGDIAVKGNIAQSGNLDPGTPVSQSL